MDKEKLRKLTDIINKHAKAYYEDNNPTISDKEYDELYYSLVKMEQEYNFRFDDSPTHRVGGEPLTNFEKYKHKLKLFSLDKAKGSDELKEYFDKISKFYNTIPEMTVEHKFDGLTISITYDNGKMISAATRGNGVVGELVTEQVKTIKSVPLVIKYKGFIEVQGEGIMSFASFEKYNKKAETPLKNARNGVAGAIRNLDPKVTASRMLDFVAYNIGYSRDKVFDTQKEVNDFLKENGFVTDSDFTIIKSYEEAKTVIDKIEDGRSEYKFPIDGAVLKINSMALREKIGETEKFPRWAIAYKYDADETTTVLKDVIWQVSRTRKLNPIAILEPVELMGVTVERATLNNWDDIKKKGVKINSRVFIRRSNDVIPEIMGIAEDSENSIEIKKPTVCPCCGSAINEEGAFLYCSNKNCSSAIIDNLDHFASKECMNIDGFSEKTAELLYSNLNITKSHQLYELVESDFKDLEGFGDKKIQNLLKSINNSKNVLLDRFIFALGIQNIGKKAAKQLAETFKTLEKIENATVAEISMIQDFGDITAKSVYDFMHNQDNLDEINNLLKYITFIEEDVKTGIFENKNVVLTGSLSKYKRSEAANIIINNGGKISDSVSKSVNLVICGDDPGSKLEKAKKLNIEIWDENKFLDEIKNFI